jgi:hypothetical protein
VWFFEMVEICNHDTVVCFSAIAGSHVVSSSGEAGSSCIVSAVCVEVIPNRSRS